jgi:ABC-type amino acid transport substrate-binding protein
LPGSFARQDYGIALPTANPYREAINQALLQILNTQAWEDLLFDYFGKQDWARQA